MTIEHGPALLFVQRAKIASSGVEDEALSQEMEAVIEVYGLAQEARA
jgi:hypothetical protein